MSEVLPQYSFSFNQVGLVRVCTQMFPSFFSNGELS